jgi:hypothetical protein
MKLKKKKVDETVERKKDRHFPPQKTALFQKEDLDTFLDPDFSTIRESFGESGLISKKIYYLRDKKLLNRIKRFMTKQCLDQVLSLFIWFTTGF